MSWAPDNAYVINLDSRPDRMEQFQLNDFGFPVQRIAGQLPQLRNGWKSSPEALGCALSHREALTRSHGGLTLVMEDDVIVGPHFPDQVGGIVRALPSDWQLLKLGGEHLLPSEPISPGIVRCQLTVRTHAYLLRDESVAKQLMKLIDAANVHWDANYGLSPAYAPDPFLVRTSGSPSDIPDSRELSHG